uniref:Rab-GAP TBC domain-containing protein n=1 Tax=Theileria parva TaxID=5875 RepID=Q4N382_THEPA|eukprot:XP_763740.1 hypothetical protein [Theileria parva strain Muguga]
MFKEEDFWECERDSPLFSRSGLASESNLKMLLPKFRNIHRISKSILNKSNHHLLTNNNTTNNNNNSNNKGNTGESDSKIDNSQNTVNSPSDNTTGEEKSVKSAATLTIPLEGDTLTIPLEGATLLSKGEGATLLSKGEGDTLLSKGEGEGDTREGAKSGNTVNSSLSPNTKDTKDTRDTRDTRDTKDTNVDREENTSTNSAATLEGANIRVPLEGANIRVPLEGANLTIPLEGDTLKGDTLKGDTLEGANSGNTVNSTVDNTKDTTENTKDIVDSVGTPAGNTAVAPFGPYTVTEHPVPPELSRLFRLDSERTFKTPQYRDQFYNNLCVVYERLGDYHQGEGFVIALLSIYLNAVEVVNVMTVMSRHYLPGYFSAKPKPYVRDSKVLMLLLERRNHKLYDVITELIVPEAFVSKWFIGLGIHIFDFEAISTLLNYLFEQVIY